MAAVPNEGCRGPAIRDLLGAQPGDSLFDTSPLMRLICYGGCRLSRDWETMLAGIAPGRSSLIRSADQSGPRWAARVAHLHAVEPSTPPAYSQNCSHIRAF
ncbi:hypothetical protein D1007_59094 [Hordeum vulgare]|nr:hypothetical protein D1007_59094 [Hordeum vulgare]